LTDPPPLAENPLETVAVSVTSGELLVGSELTYAW
jgi:hypothetical protein